MAPRLFTLIILCCATTLAWAQKLSPESKKVKYAYDELMKLPTGALLQVKYIQAFPANRNDFINIFNPDNQQELTTHGVDYVKKFRKLGFDYPDSVLPKSIMIGKDLNAWSEGVVDQLQKTIYYITDKNPQLFVNTVKLLKKDEQERLANFLYAGPNGKNENYEVLVQIFEKAGEKKILNIFKAAPRS